MHKNYDALIAGAGPAGAAVAIHLARAGWHVLLIDAGRFPRHKVCGECLGAAALPLLDELGVGSLVRSELTWHERMRLVLPHRRQIDLPLERFGPLALLSISRYRLDQLLLDQARLAGVEILLEHRVRRVLIAEGRATGLVIAPVRRPLDQRLLCAPLVVAADGRDSVIVKQTGRVQSGGETSVGFKQHFTPPEPRLADESSTLVMRSFPGGYLGICATDHGSLNVCGVVPRGALSAARGSIAAVLKQHGIDRELSDWTGSDTGQQRGWLATSPVQRQLATPMLAGVLYAGDAQGTIEPLAGQGITMALAGGQLAARLLLTEGNFGALQPLQHEYERLWLQQFARPIRWGACFGWLLRRPKFLNAALCLPSPGSVLEANGLRWGYRSTRLPALTGLA